MSAPITYKRGYENGLEYGADKSLSELLELRAAAVRAMGKEHGSALTYDDYDEGYLAAFAKLIAGAQREG